MKIGQLVLALFALISSAACQQKCQAPVTTPFQTFTGQDWRLISTTDPSPNYKNLSNTNTIILNFKDNYQGEVDSLIDNTRTPALGLTYNVSNTNAQSGQIKITYYPINTDPSQGSGAATTYNYTLNTTFTMVDAQKGYVYNYVAFEGIVHPDQICTF